MGKTWFFIQGSYNKVLLIALFCLLTFETLSSQKNTHTDYQNLFGKQYTEACNYLNSNCWITDSLVKNGIDPILAKAIIFPELIRYSAIKDKIEIGALLTLYVQYGADYANFSIGRFQIKPSFAIEIEQDLKKDLHFKKDKLVSSVSIYNTHQARLERIKRLESPAWQLQYLIWFFRIMEKNHGADFKTYEDKVRFYATAYNCGYSHSTDYIKKMSTGKYFHVSLFKGSEVYNYADISLHYLNSSVR